MEGIVPTLDYNNNGYGDCGFGGGGIWAILIIAVLFGGFGGRGCGGNDVREASDNAELNARFNGIENRIDNLGNREDLARNLTAVCDTQRDVLETKCGLTEEILENRYNSALGNKDLAMQLAECCCTTQRSIDNVNFQASQNTCAILSAVACESQKTRDLIQGYAYEAEKEKNLQLRMEVAALKERDFYRPAATPAYPSVPSQYVLNPAAYGFGGCCNNGIGAYGFCG